MELRLVEVTSTPEEDDERRRQAFNDLLQNNWLGTPSSSQTDEERARTRRHELFMNREWSNIYAFVPTCYSISG